MWYCLRCSPNSFRHPRQAGFCNCQKKKQKQNEKIAQKPAWVSVTSTCDKKPETSCKEKKKNSRAPIQSCLGQFDKEIRATTNGKDKLNHVGTLHWKMLLTFFFLKCDYRMPKLEHKRYTTAVQAKGTVWINLLKEQKDFLIRRCVKLLCNNILHSVSF